MAARKLSHAQQRDRRAKLMLVVLGVVLVAVVGFEATTFLGGKGTSATATETLAIPDAGTPALVAGEVTGAPSQLTRFSRFTAKDPFHALVSTTSTNPTPSQPLGSKPAPPATTAAASTTPTRIPAPPVTLGIQPVTTPTTETSKPAGPLVTAAVLQLNGVRRVVTVGATFPDKHPVFKLLAVGSTTMWLRLLGGSLTSGTQTLAIRFGHPVQLVNQTADLKYLLRFLKVTVAAPPTTTAPTVTVAQASP